LYREWSERVEEMLVTGEWGIGNFGEFRVGKSNGFVWKIAVRGRQVGDDGEGSSFS